MNSERQSDREILSRSAGREGAALVLVICATAVLLTLSLGAAAFAADRARRAADALARIELRDAARSALARAAWALCSDTNGVDHLGEDWAVASAESAAALERGGDGVFATVSDECARLGFPECGETALAALLAETTGADEATARGRAQAAFLWKKERDAAAAAFSGATNAVLAAEEELLAVPSGEPDGLRPALPFLSVHAGVRLNANTAPREAVVAAILGAGGTRGGAEGVWTRLAMSRARGDSFESATPDEALKLLRGEGDEPTPEELDALRRLQPRLCVASDRFRLAAVARRGPIAVRVECVWDRASRRVLRWAE